MDDHTLAWLIDCAIGWESQARDIYFSFGKLFSHVPRVAEVWLDLADDETRHVGFLLKIRGTAPHEHLASQVGQAQREAAVEVEQFLRGDLTVAIQTLDDAYELAHMIEQSEMNAIFRYVAQESVPDEARRLLLLAQLDIHIEKLSAFGREFDRQQRMRILAASQFET
jgi:rubrerythrin